MKELRETQVDLCRIIKLPLIYLNTNRRNRSARASQPTSSDGAQEGWELLDGRKLRRIMKFSEKWSALRIQPGFLYVRWIVEHFALNYFTWELNYHRRLFLCVSMPTTPPDKKYSNINSCTQIYLNTSIQPDVEIMILKRKALCTRKVYLIYLNAAFSLEKHWIFIKNLRYK